MIGIYKTVRRVGRGLPCGLIGWACCIGLSAPPHLAGLSAQSVPTFAAVSIKKLQPSMAVHLGPDRTDPAGVHFSRTSLRGLIAYAYGIKLYQIAGLQPGWMATVLVVDATTSAPATDQELRLMMRRALAERFGLRLSAAPKQMPVLALVVAPGGLKLKPLELGQDPTPGPPQPGALNFRVDSTQQLIRVLAMARIGNLFFGRTIVDETGLTGRYNLSFYLRESPTTTPGGRPAIALDWRGMPAALKKVGLELKPKTAPMVVYTIESAHPPVGN